MKWFYNFIAKHEFGLSMWGIISICIVADSELHYILKMLPITIILLTLGSWGRHIKKLQEDEESL